MTNKTNKTSKTSKTTAKRLSKGQRTHLRRLKQETRKAGGIYKLANQKVTPSVEKA